MAVEWWIPHKEINVFINSSSGSMNKYVGNGAYAGYTSRGALGGGDVTIPY